MSASRRFSHKETNNTLEINKTKVSRPPKLIVDLANPQNKIPANQVNHNGHPTGLHVSLLNEVSINFDSLSKPFEYIRAAEN